MPSTASDHDLLRIVHADAASFGIEVGPDPATAVVVDADGGEWIGVANVHPYLGEVLAETLPGAAVLWWDPDSGVI